MNHNIKRQRHQRNLPDDADGDIEDIAAEVLVALEPGIFGQHLLEHRSPEAPRTNAAIKVHQHGVVLRRGEEGTEQAADERDSHDQREDDHHFHVDDVARQQMLKERHEWNNLRHDQRRGDAGEHTPEVAPTIEAPPVPLEHVGSGVAAP